MKRFPAFLILASFCFFCKAAQADMIALPFEPKPLSIVASFSLLADIAHEVGGENVDVVALAGPETEVHAYVPTPEDVKKLAKADLIVINGLGLETWLARLIDASGSKARLIVASAGVRPRLLEQASAHRHDAKTREERSGALAPIVDPHAWLDPANGKLYARNIARAILEARLDLKQKIEGRLNAYLEKIDALEGDLREEFAAIPQERKKAVVDHDAFGYFARAYGITFYAVTLPDEAAEPSAADGARMIRLIKETGVKAVFSEEGLSPRLAQQLAKDANVHVGGRLYADTLSAPDGEAPSYLAALKHNADLLLASMK